MFCFFFPHLLSLFHQCISAGAWGRSSLTPSHQPPLARCTYGPFVLPHNGRFCYVCIITCIVLGFYVQGERITHQRLSLLSLLSVRCVSAEEVNGVFSCSHFLAPHYADKLRGLFPCWSIRNGYDILHLTPFGFAQMRTWCSVLCLVAGFILWRWDKHRHLWRTWLFQTEMWVSLKL